MQKLLVFAFALQLLCCSEIIAEYEEEFPIASHFKPSELANLTPQKEHQLQLKAVVNKIGSTWIQILLLETYAKATGNEFYGLMDDGKANRESTAIIKAVFACFGKLPIQFHAYKVYTTNLYKLVSPTLPHDEISNIFQNFSSAIDDQLKNEPIYTILRDEYMKSESWKTKKIFQYGIPKTEGELQAAIAQLLNDPLMKKHYVNSEYFGGNPQADDAQNTRDKMTNLANIPGKLETVQKIYDQIVSLIPDIPANKIIVKESLNLEKMYGVKRTIIFSTLQEKIAKIRT